MRKPKTKKNIPLSRALLEAAALRYVSRYAASEAMLIRTLQRRVDKAVRHFPETDCREAENWIKAILASYTEKGWVNDGRFAESVVRTGRQGGRSRNTIRQKMLQKGIDRTVINHTFEILEGEHDADDMDLAAALLHAKRKKLGPFRVKKVDASQAVDVERKDMARLCRAGFAPSIARKALMGDN